MAVPVYHNGADGRAFSKPAGASVHVEIPITKWDMRITANNQQVSNAKDGRKRIAGVPDASGSATLHWDSANNLIDAVAGPGLKHGAVILLEMAVDVAGATDTTKTFRASAIIDEVNPSSDFDGTIDFSVTWSLESGTSLKYPGDT
jgi:poly-gamma-glutamate capsule biosynthesis protein CapA/YwtB (metallophosphatase superfamily)